LGPKCPSPRINVRCVWQRDEEYGFPRQAVQDAAAREKPYPVLIGEEGCAGICPVHIL
jgi:hypothetical protein